MKTKTIKIKYGSKVGKTKKIKTKKKIIKKEYDQNDLNDKIELIREALKENYSQQKKLMNDLRELLLLQGQETRLSIKSGNNNNKIDTHVNISLNKPVPKKLKKLLKIDEDMLPIPTVLELLFTYFKKHKMYGSATKKNIIPNDKIKEIFGMNENDVMDFYNIQSWLRKIYNENDVINATE